MNTDKAAQLEIVIDAAKTLIDFVIGRNNSRTDILDGLNEIRTAAQNDIDDLNGANP